MASMPKYTIHNLNYKNEKEDEIMRTLIKIIVNLVTSLRLIFSIFLLFLLTKISNTSFLMIMIIMFLTDWIDGFLARKFKVQTLFGSALDTIADKIFCIILIIPLLNKVNSFVLILIGEIFIAAINIIAYFKGKQTKAHIIGKTKMWALSITITLGYTYLFNYTRLSVILLSLIITFVLQLLTFITYIDYLKKQVPHKEKYSKIKTFGDIFYRLFSTSYYLDKKA